MIIYASRTGNVRSIVNKLDINSIEIKDGLTINYPFFIFTYTDGLGDIPKVVTDFMEYENNWKYCKGIVVSGNTNFGMNYCLAGDKLSKKYNIPIIEKLDLRGQKNQLENIKRLWSEMI